MTLPQTETLLTPQQRADFERDGFPVVCRAPSPEVKSGREALAVGALRDKGGAA